MSKEELFSKLRQGILNYDSEMTKKGAEEIIEKGIPVLEAISALNKATVEQGERFARFEVFLTHLMMTADALNAALKVLLPKIPKDKVPRVGTVLIGTVKGDIHDIGKTIVATMLTASGFEVHDLGKDVSSTRFAEEAEKLDPDIVAASALMTTTKPALKDLVDYFKAVGIREKYKIMVGGAPVNASYAEEIGADSYAPDAVEAAKVAKKLIAKTKAT